MTSHDEIGIEPLAAGWRLEGSDEAGREIRLVFSDEELSRAYLGLTIGRHPKLCERVLEDSSISRRHLRIGLRNGELIAEDVNSLNSTLLDGQALAPFQAVVLRDGQTLTVGRILLRICQVRGNRAVRDEAT